MLHHNSMPWFLRCSNGSASIFRGVFAINGLRKLTFDYRGFEASDGELGRLVPAMRIEDIDVVD